MDERKLINEDSKVEHFIEQHLLYLNDGQEALSLYYWIREQNAGNTESDRKMESASCLCMIFQKKKFNHRQECGALCRLGFWLLGHSCFAIHPPQSVPTEAP